MNTHPGVELFLSRFAESEWHGVVRPWLEGARGRLERALVVAPTRGQTHALKQRCLAEGVPLLGVEFLTPGLARRKRAAGISPGRTLQLLVLRSRIEERLAPLGHEDPARLLWRSLASDLDTALDDFEELVRAGFRPEDFPGPQLQGLFGELSAWIGGHGYSLAPLEDEAAGLGKAPAGSPPITERMLILAGGAEGWGDFFGLAALARRSANVCVVLSEPDFRGGGGSLEPWVELWQALLGVEAALVDAPDPQETCAEVAALWGGDASSAERAQVIVGRSKADEMERVAAAIAALLDRGADNIAVVFPGADAAHARLARLLENRGVPFADMIGTPGTPPLDSRIQRAVVDFYERGCRIEELLALWPLLRALNLAAISPASARAVCGRLFDDVQSHRLEAHVASLEGSADADRREVGRVARLLLPGWPKELTLAAALDRFEAVRDRLMLSAPPGWPFLREFAKRAGEAMPAQAILEAIRGFLPEKGPAAGHPGGRGGFAHVTLTTARRAAGVAWSHAVFVEANAGIWPERREPSCWLGDEDRRALTVRGRFSLGLATADERAAIERRVLCTIARDTRKAVLFSASAFDEDDPEAMLEPNAWLERVMWSRGLLSAEGAGADAFRRLAGAPASKPQEAPPAALKAWSDVWISRRDPSAPFDEFFFSEPGERPAPRLSAVLIERGTEDPVRLWFGAVLGIERVEWRPFGRARRKAMGEAVHKVLAAALRGAPRGAGFFPMPDRAAAEARLAAELGALRARWPSDRYWDSFHLDVCAAARDLLARVFSLPAAGYAAVEMALPAAATVPAGEAGSVPVRGRVDVVIADRAQWEGAHVEIADFKTGGVGPLSVRSMASRGASLQLGVYLEAARSAGASGSVWMLRPGRQPSRIETGALADALARLRVLGMHLSMGVYGALTPDRDEYTPIFEWPLACAPIASVVLRQKFARTFGAAALPGAAGGDDE